MDTLSQIAAHVVTRWPRAILATVIALTLAAVVPLTQLDTKVDIREFYPQRGAIAAQDLRARVLPGGAKPIPIVVSHPNGNALSAASIRDTIAFAQHLRTHPKTSRLFPHANFFSGPHRWVEAFVARANRLLRSGELRCAPRCSTTGGTAAPTEAIELQFSLPFGDGEVAALLGQLPSEAQLTVGSLSDAQIDAVVKRVLERAPHWRNFASNDLGLAPAAAQAEMSLLLAFRDRDAFDAISEDSEFAVLAAAAQFLPSHGTKFLPFGGLSAEIARDQQSVLLLLALTVLIVVLICFRATRSVVDTAMILLGIAIVNVWMFGLASALGWRVSLLTIMAPILITALGVDYALHSLERYHQERNLGKAPRQAIFDTVTTAGRANLLAALTTAAGFAASLSPLPAVRNFGLTVALGMCAAYVVLCLGMLAFRSLRDRHAHSLEQSTPRGKLNKWLRAGLAHPRLVAASVIIVTAGSALSARGLGSEFDWRDSLSRDARVVRLADTLEQRFAIGSIDEVDIVVSGDLSQPSSINAIRGFVAAAQHHRHVARDAQGRAQVTSIIDAVGEFERRTGPLLHQLDSTLPSSERTRVMLTGIANSGNVYVTAADEQLLPAFPISALLDKRLRHTLITLRVINATQNTQVLRAIRSDVLADLPRLTQAGLTAELTGPPILRFEVIDGLARSTLQSAGITAIICFGLLIFAFRSLRTAAITMLPVLIAATWLLGAMRVAGLPLNMLTVLITSMCIGAGVDYAIHVTSRYREMRAQGLSPADAASAAAEHSLPAMTSSAATTALGFVVLIAAPQAAFRILGLLTFVVIASAFVLALIVLPILLRVTRAR